MSSVAYGNPDWAQFGEWHNEFERMRDEQVRRRRDGMKPELMKLDRTKLDYILPEDYVFTVLFMVNDKYFRSADGWIRCVRYSPDDEIMSATEVYAKYGAALLESTIEYGSTHPERPDTYTQA